MGQSADVNFFIHQAPLAELEVERIGKILLTTDCAGTTSGQPSELVTSARNSIANSDGELNDEIEVGDSFKSAPILKAVSAEKQKNTSCRAEICKHAKKKNKNN
jgi:hypothetical protein